MAKKSPKALIEYRNPLGTRYASAAMSRLFSENYRAEVWRRLWVILAEEEKKLGLPIKDKQIQAMKKAVGSVDLERVRELELELKHDVMSHIKAFGEDAPEAEPIIHLGATSCFVTDNADVLIVQEASELVLKKTIQILQALSNQIDKHKALACSGFTHFQPAQPTTMGKRFSLWAQDLIWDVEELEYCLERLLPLGCKGATGTQASFEILFGGDLEKVKRLDEAVCKRMGFSGPVAVSGQTLSRKVDAWFLNALSNLGSSLSKLSYDMRLLQHLGQVREPFGKKQVGSSAMAYKRNPMLAERLTSLSRFLMSLSQNASWTHSVQWLERSLDDSANRRLVLPEAFLAADSICEIALRIVEGLEVDEKAIEKHLQDYLPHFETEAEMMRGTLSGGSRQELHEEIRRKTVVKKQVGSRENISAFTGLAQIQAEDFLKKQMKPFLAKRKSSLNSLGPRSASI